MIRLPPIEAVIIAQDELIQEFGGSAGLRSREMLEQSLARLAQILAYQEGADRITVAVALCASLCRNHAFVDGNKRIALEALGMALLLNGAYLDVSETDAATQIMALAAGSLDEPAFQAWVRENTRSA